MLPDCIFNVRLLWFHITPTKIRTKKRGRCISHSCLRFDRFPIGKRISLIPWDPKWPPVCADVSLGGVCDSFSLSGLVPKRCAQRESWSEQQQLQGPVGLSSHKVRSSVKVSRVWEIRQTEELRLFKFVQGGRK